MRYREVKCCTVSAWGSLHWNIEANLNPNPKLFTSKPLVVINRI